MSHQQLRSYGDGTSVLSLIRKTGEAMDQTLDPCLQGITQTCICKMLRFFKAVP